MTFVASPANTWDESPDTAVAIARLVPYLTTAGYWVLVPRGTQPAGAIEGALVDGSYDTLSTATTSGLRIARTPAGPLSFF